MLHSISDVCYFDNISKISDTISDLLCRAITGSGFLKRELFTDDEDIIYELRYCLGLTRINLAATKSDLLDRGLIIEHKPIYKQDIKRLKHTSEKSLLEFQERFSREYDIELEIKNRYDKLLLSAGKKHYIGYEKGIIDSVGFEGEKSDRCQFFHKVYEQLINDIIKQEIDPIPNLRKAISDLDSANKVNPDLLKISKVLNRELEDYDNTTQIYNIGKALGAKKGDLVEYFSSDKKKTGKSWTTNTNNPAEIDISHYKQLLWNTIDEILEIAGYLLRN